MAGAQRAAARLKRTWKTLMKDIAHDVEIFERFCDVAPAADEMSGTQKRIYLSYRNQTIKLFGGGGTYIPPVRRKYYHVSDPWTNQAIQHSQRS
jgi:hypothetical protein